jgi:tRNA (cytidine56-2'-O)-methyltransferase
MKIRILRLGHRFARDKRTSTHIALVARSFGADELVIDAIDNGIVESISKLCDEWGGNLEINFTGDWKKFVREFKGDRVHLTMYGININDCMDKIKSSGRDKLIIIGGAKVPSDLYSLVDYNVAVGNQPHSEVAALAVFLDRMFDGRELEREFNGKKRIIPREHGKRVVEPGL